TRKRVTTRAPTRPPTHPRRRVRAPSAAYCPLAPPPCEGHPSGGSSWDAGQQALVGLAAWGQAPGDAVALVHGVALHHRLASCLA
ncbi:hypothetical protein HaLaN_16370, partial [Haematococcus lacustris]